MLTASRLRDLAAHVGDPAIASVYLDVDGSRRPVWADCVGAFDRLAERLAEQAARYGDNSTSITDSRVPQLARSAGSDIARMRRWLDSGVDRDHTRGVALFACAEQDYLQVVEVPAPVPDGTALGPVAQLAPLLRLLDRRRPALVALSDRRQLRVFSSTLGELTEIATTEDPEPRRLDTSLEIGSFDRHGDEAAESHRRHVAATITRAMAAAGAEQVVLAGPDPAVTAIIRHLPEPVAAALAGRLRLAATATAVDVASALARLQEDVARQQRAVAIERLTARAGADDGAVLGVDHVLRTLGSGALATLLVCEDLVVPGGRCPTCGGLQGGPADEPCATCGGELVACHDVVALAVARSLTSGADVVVCDPGELDGAGGIGAMQRW